MALKGSVSTNSGWTSGAGLTRLYTFEWTATQSTSGNYSTISWALKSAGTYTPTVAEWQLHLYIDGTAVYSKNYMSSGETRPMRGSGVTIATGTKVVQHDENGNASFSVKIDAAVYYSSINCTGATTFTLDQIPRKSTLSGISPTLCMIMGSKQTLNVVRQSTAFTHTITWACGSESGTICTKSTEKSVEWTPPVSCANQIPNDTEIQVTFTITTYNGNTAIGSVPYSCYLSVPFDRSPSCSLDISDVTGCVSKYGNYVKGQSKLGITVNAAGQYGANISSYTTKVDGITYTTRTFETDVLKKNGSITITATVTDSRGGTAEAISIISVIDYTLPSITGMSVYRCNEDGTANVGGAFLCVKFSSVVSALNNQNGVIYNAQYKKTTDAEYGNPIILTDYSNTYYVENGSYVFAADTASSYNVLLTVTDNFDTATKEGTGGTINAFISVLKGAGIALGKVAEWVGFEVNMNARFLKSLYVKDQSSGVFIDVVDKIKDAITSDNIGRQSVDYANSAGTATNANLAYNLRNNLGYTMAFNWTGQSGQPSWLWGSNDGKSINVYNPSNFSVNYAASAGNGITEMGTANGGTYYKFGNGALICIKNVQVTNVACSKAYGAGMYESGSISLGNWPCAFNALPTVQHTFIATAGSAISEGAMQVSTSSCGVAYLMRPTSATISGYISIVGIGRWK